MNILTSDFSTPSFNFKRFNTRLMVEKFGVEKPGLKNGLKHGVENFGVEMSFNRCEDPSRCNHLWFKKWQNWNLEQENFEKGIVFRGSTWKCSSKPQFQPLISIRHTSSVERFSENFDEKAETCLIFFLGMHWFQKCNFWKNSLSPFQGCWGPRGQTA